jgi:hypothetical protein
VSAEREGVDATVRLPFRQAPLEIRLDACGGLIPLLGGLGQQFHHDRGERRGNCLRMLVGRDRLPGDVAVHPLHRIRRAKRQRACKHLVKRAPQCIEIAPGVDRPVHSSGLLGRHIGERPGDELGSFGRLTLARKPRRDTEAGQPDPVGCDVDDHIGRLDVLMDETALVHLAKRSR